MCDPHGDASKNNEKVAKSPLLGDSGHLFAPVLSRSHTSFLEVPETCRPILTSPMFREIFGRFLSTSLAPFFWALSGQIFLTVRRQEKKKENIPDGANKGNAREVVGEGVLRVFWTGGLRRGRGLTDMNTMKWSDGRIQVEGCHAPFCLFVILLITSGLLCSCRTPASSINILLYAIS